MLVPSIVLGAALVMMLVERLRPGRPLPKVRGWWTRALLLNGFQAGSVWIAGALWDRWLLRASPWPAGTMDRLGPVLGALVGYLVLTFVYYFWHRARHEVPFLWRWLHQVHHSVSRIEIFASFYKHPLEVLLNSVISSAVLYLVCGLSPAAATGATLLTGLAELVYHWNVRTPRWLGYVFQRPEMHQLHHADGVHRYNYADLPLWDLLFGTFANPERVDRAAGLGGDREQRLGEMLRGVDVTRPRAKSTGRAAIVLFALGLVQMSGDLLGVPELVGLGAASGASPAPKVFTRVGDAEPFSATFALSWRDEDGIERELALTPERYAAVSGPYNRRNVFGAVVAGGPHLADAPHVGPMMTSAARYSLCGDAPLLVELGVDRESIAGPITIVQHGRDGRTHRWVVSCDP